MIHQVKYDTLCRVLTDYEGYGTEDDDVIGNIDYVADYLMELSKSEDINLFVQDTIETVVEHGEIYDLEEIYDLACHVQNTWEDIWNDTTN